MKDAIPQHAACMDIRERCRNPWAFNAKVIRTPHVAQPVWSNGGSKGEESKRWGARWVQVCACDNLNQNGPHRLMCSDARSKVDGTAWEGLGVVALWEEVCYCG